MSAFKLNTNKNINNKLDINAKANFIKTADDLLKDINLGGDLMKLKKLFDNFIEKYQDDYESKSFLSRYAADKIESIKYNECYISNETICENLINYLQNFQNKKDKNIRKEVEEKIDDLVNSLVNNKLNQILKMDYKNSREFNLLYEFVNGSYKNNIQNLIQKDLLLMLPESYLNNNTLGTDAKTNLDFYNAIDIKEIIFYQLNNHEFESQLSKDICQNNLVNFPLEAKSVLRITKKDIEDAIDISNTLKTRCTSLHPDERDLSLIEVGIRRLDEIASERSNCKEESNLELKSIKYLIQRLTLTTTKKLINGCDDKDTLIKKTEDICTAVQQLEKKHILSIEINTGETLGKIFKYIANSVKALLELISSFVNKTSSKDQKINKENYKPWNEEEKVKILKQKSKEIFFKLENISLQNSLDSKSIGL